MGFFDFLIPKKKQVTNTPTLLAKPETSNDFPIPVQGGRGSVDNNQLIFNNALSELQPDFPIEYLSTLEFLAYFDPDFSYALDNILSISKTKFTINFDSSVSDKDALAMQQHIDKVSKNWYGFSGGINSLISDLLSQLAIYGCISAEFVPNEKLSGIAEIVRVSPRDVRFRLLDGKYIPVQKVRTFVNIPSWIKVSALNSIDLNTITYKYIALRRHSQTPYATPPFLSIMKTIDPENDLFENFAKIANKVGALGFLASYVQKLPQRPQETEPQYWARCTAYLNSVAPEMEKSLSKGFVVGFKDVQEFKLEGNDMNVDGATGLFKLIETFKMSALKQDPNMLGRQQSTSETFGRVILAKMMTQISDYQDCVEEFLLNVYQMELVLAGFNPVNVKEVVFEKPLLGDMLKEQQTNTAKIGNLVMLYNQGIISQAQFAKEAGYDAPFAEKPVAPVSTPKPTNPTDGKTDPTKDGKSNLKKFSLKKKDQLSRQYMNYLKNLDSFDYHIPNECLSLDANYHNKEIQDEIDSYSNELKDQYTEAINQTNEAIIKKLSEGKYESEQDLQDQVLSILYAKWKPNFIDKIVDIVTKNVNDFYVKHRSDASVLGALKDIPEPEITKQDNKIMDYLANTDNIYLGKFITDDDTQSRIKAFISEAANSKGTNTATVNKFKKEFPKLLENEGWKIQRIVETTTSKTRNYGNLAYMEQAGVETFEVIEVMDRITCPYCQSMNGTTFQVDEAASNIDTFAKENLMPNFATSFKLDEFQKMDSKTKMSNGVFSPPFHPFCRGRLVAVID